MGDTYYGGAEYKDEQKIRRKKNNNGKLKTDLRNSRFSDVI